MTAAAQPMKLQAEDTIQLIRMDETLIPRFVELVRHPEINPYLPFAKDFPESKAQSILQVAQQPESGCHIWMMRTQQELADIGMISAMPVLHQKCWQIGFWVDPAYQGKGFATLAVQMICMVAFQQAGIMRVQAQVVPSNEASARVLQKVGFEREGLLKAAHLLKDEVVDTDLYAKVSL